jgi:hypothetical protein
MEDYMDLSYLPNASEGHMNPTDDVLSIWKSVKAKTDFKHIFEIGTNGGHSAAMVLTLFDDVKVTSIDIGVHSYTRVAVERLKEKFGDRFDYIERDTKLYYKDLLANLAVAPEGIDIINIDGDHSVEGASNDLLLAKHLGLKYVMLDDFAMYGVPAAYASSGAGLDVVEVYDYRCCYNSPVQIALLQNDSK